jgi:hypothetical protein
VSIVSTTYRSIRLLDQIFPLGHSWREPSRSSRSWTARKSTPPATKRKAGECGARAAGGAHRASGGLRADARMRTCRDGRWSSAPVALRPTSRAGLAPA